MKIAVVTGGFPSSGNPSKSIFNFRAVKGLQAYGEVQVFHFRYWKPGRPFLSRTQYNGVDVTAVALPWVPVQNAFLNAWNLTWWMRWSKRLLKGHLDKADIIHSMGLEIAPVAAALSKQYSIRHVAQAVGSDALIYLPMKERFFNIKNWIKHTACIICNSDFLKKHVSKRYPSIRSETVYRGTDLSRFLSEEIRKEEPLKVLYLGGFSIRKGSGFGSDLKGGELFKEVWSQLDREMNLPAELWIGGPQSDDDVQEQWRQRLTHPEKVTLLGSRSPDEIPALMRSAAIVVLPSKSEGLPNVAVEASASGALIIASEVGGIPEIVLKGETGILLPPDDSQSWKEQVKKALTDFGAFEDMRKHAQKHVQENFDALRYPKNLIAIYEQANA